MAWKKKSNFQTFRALEFLLHACMWEIMIFLFTWGKPAIFLTCRVKKEKHPRATNTMSKTKLTHFHTWLFTSTFSEKASNEYVYEKHKVDIINYSFPKHYFIVFWFKVVSTKPEWKVYSATLLFHVLSWTKMKKTNKQWAQENLHVE